jgi:hypothetical protein
MFQLFLKRLPRAVSLNSRLGWVAMVVGIVFCGKEDLLIIPEFNLTRLYFMENFMLPLNVHLSQNIDHFQWKNFKIFFLFVNFPFIFETML